MKCLERLACRKQVEITKIDPTGDTTKPEKAAVSSLEHETPNGRGQGCGCDASHITNSKLRITLGLDGTRQPQGVIAC